MKGTTVNKDRQASTDLVDDFESLPDAMNFDFGTLTSSNHSSEETRWYKAGRTHFVVTRRFNSIVPSIPTYWVRLSASPEFTKIYPDVTFTSLSQVLVYMEKVGHELWEAGLFTTT